MKIIFIVIILVFLAISLLTGTAVGDISRTGLVAEWHFDGDASDTSGYGNNGDINGASLAEGKSGRAFSFNGINDYVEVKDSTSLDVTHAITLETWVYPVSFGQWRVILTKWSPKSYYLGCNATGFCAISITSDGRSDNGLFSSTRIGTNAWHHLVATYDSSTGQMKVYINGNLDASRVTSGAIYSGTSNIRIGDNIGASGQKFNGKIDEVRIYNRALSAQEIRANYEARTSSPPGNKASGGAFFTIIVIILFTATTLFYLWTKDNLQLLPEQTKIPCDGKSALIKVQFANVFGKARKQNKDRIVELKTTSGGIDNAVIPAGKEFIEATLTSSHQSGPVLITAKSGKHKAEVQVQFVSEKEGADTNQKTYRVEQDEFNPSGAGWHPQTVPRQEHSGDTSHQSSVSEPQGPSAPTTIFDKPIVWQQRLRTPPWRNWLTVLICIVIAGMVAIQFAFIQFFIFLMIVALIWLWRGTGSKEGRRDESIEGEVRGFDRESCTFRLHRYDSAGNRLSPIPVEMLGMLDSFISGVVKDGDRVEVKGKWKAGKTFKAKHLRNLTTGVIIKENIPFEWIKIAFGIEFGIGLLIFIIVLLFFLLLIVGIILGYLR